MIVDGYVRLCLNMVICECLCCLIGYWNGDDVNGLDDDLIVGRVMVGRGLFDIVVGFWNNRYCDWQCGNVKECGDEVSDE